MYFQKTSGKYIVLKEHIKDFFRTKSLIFDKSSINDQSLKDTQLLLQQSLVKDGSVPYITLHLGDKNVQFTLDSGCSGNLLNPKTYSLISHIESHSYTAENISLRTIDNSVKNNVISRVTFLPFRVNDKVYQIKFYVSKNINRNFLGTNFIRETQANMLFQDVTKSHVL